MKRPWILLILLAVTVTVWAFFGALLKYGMFRKLDMETEENIITLPFVLLADPALSHTFTEKLEAVVNPTVPAVTEPTETTADTEPTEATNEALIIQPDVTLPTEPEGPVYSPVAESWFDDVLFIGDSRTDGMKYSARLGQADYFSTTNMMVFDVRYVKCTDRNFYQKNLEAVLSAKTYGKIYIHLGINECGTDQVRFTEYYQKLVDLVRQKQPDAYIILQGIMPVNRKWATNTKFLPEVVEEYNQIIRSFVVDEKMRYCDTNLFAADEAGFLREELTNDGCHPHGEGVKLWAQWLLEDAGWYDIP